MMHEKNGDESRLSGGCVAVSGPRAGACGAPCRAIDAIYVIDWLMAMFLLVLSFPIIVLAVVWVLLVDFGMPFYVQTRIGLGGRSFRIFKLRSMYLHAQSGEARFCAEGDTRIIPGGGILRKLRIDEIPQFLNVMKGDMALVGPRPEQEAFVLSFRETLPNYERRHEVRPGITGLAQVRMGYVDDERGTYRKLRYDLLFVRTRSLRSWLFILVSTVRVVIGFWGR